MNKNKRHLCRLIALFAMAIAPAFAVATTATKPNILVIMSDDVGITNLSAYSRGMAGYHTPNIDRIANEAYIPHESSEV